MRPPKLVRLIYFSILVALAIAAVVFPTHRWWCVWATVLGLLSPFYDKFEQMRMRRQVRKHGGVSNGPGGFGFDGVGEFVLIFIGIFAVGVGLSCWMRTGLILALIVGACSSIAFSFIAFISGISDPTTSQPKGPNIGSGGKSKVSVRGILSMFFLAVTFQLGRDFDPRKRVIAE